MTLTPEQIDLIYAELPEGSWRPCCEDIAETLVDAYVDIVQRLAEMDLETNEYGYSYCMFCDAGEAVVGYTVLSEPVRKLDHAPDCLYLAARKLRGLDG